MLTDKKIRGLLPREKEYLVSDGGGLALRVWPSGAKAWIYRYRINGRAERLTLGSYPEMTLKQAREAHAEARKQVQAGMSPAYNKQVQKGALAASHDPDTVRALSDEFMERYIEKERKRPDHVRQMLDADVLPTLGKVKIRDITRRHIVQLLDRIVDRGARVQANRTASMLKQMFQFAVERGFIDGNPCADIRRRTVGGTEHARDRVMTIEEIRVLWPALDRLARRNEKAVRPAPGRKVPAGDRKSAQIGEPSALALKLLLVTGQRRGELTKALWADIDLNNGIWRIPETKNGREHRVPLPALAVALLTHLKALAGDSEFVLPSPAKEGPVSERSITKAAERVRDALDMKHWTPHDLRRTAATGMADAGALPHVVEKVLNHTMQGVMAIYNRHDYFDECRAALAAWGRQLENVGMPEHGNVIPLFPKVA